MKKKISTKKTTINSLVKTAGKGVETLDNALTDMVFSAFPGRDFVRHVESVLKVNAYDGECCYTYVFEVDESNYRISSVAYSGLYAIGPDEGFDDNSIVISLTAKSIREAVEYFEREASGDSADHVKPAEPETEGTLDDRVAVLEALVDKFGNEITNIKKEIKSLKAKAKKK